MTVLVIVLAIIITLLIFGQRTMNVFRPASRALGLDAVFTRTQGRGGSSQVSYVWWRLVMMQIWRGRY